MICQKGKTFSGTLTGNSCRKLLLEKSCREEPMKAALSYRQGGKEQVSCQKMCSLMRNTA